MSHPEFYNRERKHFHLWVVSVSEFFFMVKFDFNYLYDTMIFFLHLNYFLSSYCYISDQISSVRLSIHTQIDWCCLYMIVCKRYLSV